MGIKALSSEEIIELSTLTGAILIALVKNNLNNYEKGVESSGIFSNDENLKNCLINAG